jgi:hypothetical protein
MCAAPVDDWLNAAALAEAQGDFARAIAEYTRANRARADERIECELVRLRHAAFLAGAAQSDTRALPPSDVAVPVDASLGLPVVESAPSAAVLRSAIESHGSLIVRRLIGSEHVSILRDAILSAIRAREAQSAGSSEAAAWYREFPPVDVDARLFTVTDGVLGADSPRGLFRILEAFHAHGVDELAADFLGGRPAISAEKTVLRCINPQPPLAWHQDGAFLGERIRTLDVWIALTPCGRKTPGLEVLPRRVDRVLPTGGLFSWGLPNEVVAAAYPGVAGVQPEFEPGDAMLFDQLCVHRTGYLPGMQESRLGIECWFFAPSAMPRDYSGLLV